jgi:hypothetical protein
MEDRFKSNPDEKVVITAGALLPDMEEYLCENPEKAADRFLDNEIFRELLFSRIPPEEMLKAKKMAQEKNASIDDILNAKLIEILGKERKQP